MKFNLAGTLAFFTALTGLVTGQGLINGTIDRVSEKYGSDDSPPDYVYGPISGSQLTRSCALLTRQKGDLIYANGTTSSKTFGPYQGTGTQSLTYFNSEGIPDGTYVNLILDVSASADIDLHVWFNISAASPCIATFTCTQKFLTYTYTWVGYGGGGCTL
ncbi:hypothetical protein DL96DRAFT_1812743 [Flagelloscypha sp. PMI_526]|nr:hypothetical protein DL96DRAFT_1812743 [Flagelloscypha sp. PMI_526]